MKEMNEIVAAWHARATEPGGSEAVLATVVKVEGSSYRRAGARMLIFADGRSVGTISGGCLESHVIKRAWWLTESTGVRICRYDTATDEDAQWAFGLGCNGVVHVLLERLSAGRNDAQIEVLRVVREEMRVAATAVVIDTRDCPVDVGERLVVFPDRRCEGRFSNAELSKRVANDLAAVMHERISQHRHYSLDGGDVEVFLECVPPPRRLVVFGAGHDAVPVVHFAKQLGWHVTVADGRVHYARRERFPEADEVFVTNPCNPLDGCGVTPDAAVVVMTHSVDQDRELLRCLQRKPPLYVGQLGPRTRTERLLGEIGAIGATEVDLFAYALHYPIGLDIGADNPEEIALAIVGEIRAVFGDRSGAMLRHRLGTINVRQGDDSARAGVTAGTLLPPEQGAVGVCHM